MRARARGRRTKLILGSALTIFFFTYATWRGTGTGLLGHERKENAHPRKSAALSMLNGLFRQGLMEFQATSEEVVNELILKRQLTMAGPGYAGSSTDGRVAAFINLTTLENRACPETNSLAIITRIKNSAWSINEYLAHHVLLGARHVYIIDDYSEDNIREVLAPWITAGLASWTRKPKENAEDLAHEESIFLEARKNYDWVAFIDFDEYIMPFKHRCISDVLAYFTEYGGIKMKWSLYEGLVDSDKPRLRRRVFPDETFYDAISFRLARTHALTKEIGNSKHLLHAYPYMPHCLKYREPYVVVDEHFARADGRDENGKPITHCATAGDEVSTTERMLALLHIRAISVEEFMHRDIRNVFSALHYRKDEEQTFSLDETFNNSKKLIISEPMPDEMRQIALHLSHEVIQFVKF